MKVPSCENKTKEALMFIKSHKLLFTAILTAISLITSSAWSNDVFRASIQLPATATTQNIEQITLHVFDAEDALFPIVSHVFLTSELIGIPTRVGDKIFLQAELEKTKEMATTDNLWIEPEVNGETIGDRQILLAITPNISVYGSIKSQSGGFIFPDSSTQTTAFTGELDPTVIASVKDGVTWTEIAARPAGLDDGDDIGITTELDPTVISSVKDGVTWDELSGIPAGFSDNIDNEGITTETDPQVDESLTVNSIPKWNGSALIPGIMFDNEGHVGIGTSSPHSDHKLHVVGLARFDGPTGGKIHISTPGSWPGFIVLSPDGSRSDIKFDNDSIVIAKSWNEAAPQYTNGIAISDWGSVGIGTINPDSKLHVIGRTKVVGEVRTTDSNGAPRLWGQGRPGTERYGKFGVESGLCYNSTNNVYFGLSKHGVSWDGADAACPVGTWVCTYEERGTAECDTTRGVDVTGYSEFFCDGIGITPGETLGHSGWTATAHLDVMRGYAVTESGSWSGRPICQVLPVWCCSPPLF